MSENYAATLHARIATLRGELDDMRAEVDRLRAALKQTAEIDHKPEDIEALANDWEQTKLGSILSTNATDITIDALRAYAALLRERPIKL